MKKKLALLYENPFLMKVLKGFSWVAGGNIISKVVISIAYIILAKIISVEANGEFGILKSTIDNFLIFATMGIGITSTKYISEFRNTDKSKAGSIFGVALVCVLFLGLLLSIILWVFADEISIHVLKSESLSTLIVYVAFILIFSSLFSIQQGALVGLESFKTLSISYILQGVLLILFLPIGAWLFGVKGAIIGYLVSALILAMCTQYFVNKELKKQSIPLNIKNFKQSLSIIYAFAIPASLGTIIAAPTNWIINTMLVRQENGYFEMGVFSAVTLFSMGIRMLNASLGSVLLPMFISGKEQNSSKREMLNYFSGMYMSILLSLPFLIFPEIIYYILGSKYPMDKVIAVGTLSFISSIIIAHRQGISRDLIIKNKMWLSALSMLQWAAFAILIMWALHNYGAIGLSLAITLGYIANMFIFVPIFIKLNISPSFILYNRLLLLIFCLLFLFYFVNYYIDSIALRLLLNLVNAAVLMILMYKVVKNNGK